MESSRRFSALHDALGFLTGDFWTITFVKCLSKSIASSSGASRAWCSNGRCHCLQRRYGNSQAVAGIMAASLGDKLVRVRVGPNAVDHPRRVGKKSRLETVPYKVKSHVSKSRNQCPEPRLQICSDQWHCSLSRGSGEGIHSGEWTRIAWTCPRHGSPCLSRLSKSSAVYEAYGAVYDDAPESALRYEFPRIWNTKK